MNAESSPRDFENAAFFEARRCCDRDVMVVANAGSGKTHLLVEHYFELLLQGFEPAQIVAFTFTEKAASQLKTRIAERLKNYESFGDLGHEAHQALESQLEAAPIETLHQFCLKILEYSQNELPFNIIDEALDGYLQERTLRQYLRQNLDAQNPAALVLLKRYGLNRLGRLLNERLEVKKGVWQNPSADESSEGTERNLPPPTSEEQSLLKALEDLAGPLAESLQKEKARQKQMSFDDLERLALNRLQRPVPALQRYLANLRHLLVDEFQDTSPLQLGLLEALRNFSERRRSGLKIFCVGDAKQSIYRFRHVDQHLVYQTSERLLRRGGRKFDFVCNYRSAPAILDCVNRFASSAFPESHPSRPVQQDSVDGGVYVCPLELQDTEASADECRRQEARQVADHIEALQRSGEPLEGIAVLYRASASALFLREELKRRGVAYAVRGGQNLLERQEIIDLQRLLYFLADPADEISLIGVLRSPLFLISDATLSVLGLSRGKLGFYDFLLSAEAGQALQKLYPDEIDKVRWAGLTLGRWVKQASTQSASLLMRHLVERYQLAELYAACAQDDAAWLAIEQWLVWLKRLEADLPGENLAAMAALMRSVRRRRLVKTPLEDLMAGHRGVQLSTFHAAKGLEFDTVFLIDLARGAPRDQPLLQHSGGAFGLKFFSETEEDSKTPRYQALEAFHADEEREENKRLLYVAMTRAKRRLIWMRHPTSHQKAGSLQSILLSCLGEYAQQLPHRVCEFQPARALAPIEAAAAACLLPRFLLPLPDLAIEALARFEACPLAYYYAHVQGLSATEGQEDLSAFSAARRKKIRTAEMANWAEEIEARRDDLPFVIRYEDGMVRGRFDSLLRLKHGWAVLEKIEDEEGGLGRESVERERGFKLRSLACAAKKILRGEVEVVQVWVLGEKTRESFEFDAQELRRHEARMGVLLRQLREPLAGRLSQVLFNPHCEHCAFWRHGARCPIPRGLAFA